ncbi:recombinase family protein [Nocardioides nematodiphilus]|uniref:recombinase family protein n=1 Tax=Nocardioides nematodiphilus TaxID=2849669 RepID=UPI001CD93218|nr:recombinase family protein [Nocardioides nematodiphilus]MCA1984208.1 recombinase family protein [Nocardioides nematodiphilus]
MQRAHPGDPGVTVGTMQDTPKRAAIYKRLSEDRDGVGDNVADQDRGGRKLAADLGAEVVRIYNDNDRSAKAPRSRPDFAQMLLNAEDGVFDLLIVRDLDRLYRHPTDLEDLSAIFTPKGITVHQERSTHPLDMSSAQGLLVAGLMAQVNVYELRQKSARQKDMNRARAHQGVMHRGPHPYGWQSDRLTLNRVEADRVREAFKRVLGGESLRAIVNDWNACDVPSPKGGSWTYATLKQMLLRPANAGLVSYQGTILRDVEAQWEAPVDPDSYYAAKALLTAPERRKSTDNRAKHLLAGIALCGGCQNPLKSAMTLGNVAGFDERQKVMLYRCTNPECGTKVSVRRDVLDREVTKRFLDERGHAYTARVKTTEHLGERLSEVETGIRSVTAQLAEDDADTVALVERLAELKRERAELNANPTRTVWSLLTVTQEWEKAGIERKRELLRSHLVGLTVARRGKGGKAFDPTRVQIVWTEDPYDATEDDMTKTDPFIA